MSLKKLSILPIAVVSLLAAGSTAVSASPSSRHTVRPPVVAPVAVAGQAAVSLRTAGSFAILSKSGITDVPSSKITGNVGASPITGAAIGLTCPEVAGTLYSVNAAGPLPCRVTAPSVLTTAVGDLEAAYTDAAGRTNPTAVNLGAGQIGAVRR